MKIEPSYSEIGSVEESFLAFGFFFLNPIGFFIGCLMVIMMMRQLRNNQIKIQNAAVCAIIAILFQILVYFNDIFLSNDLIFKWKYSYSHWAAITDIISTIAYGLGKVLFYFAFTFHVLSVFADDSDRRFSYFLKIWMIVMGVICVIIMIIVTVDDTTTYSSKETGITSPHNVYVTMVASHEGAKIAKYSIAAMILVDIIYFGVLIFLYIKKLTYLRQRQNMENRKHLQAATKGITLIIFSCITFWLFFIFVWTDIPLKWWGAIDITSDGLCLFLMFNINDNIYRYFCGYCHTFWNKKLNGELLVDEVEEMDDHTSAL